MEETKKPASRKAILSVVVTVLVMAGVAAVIWHRSFKPDPFAPMYGCWMSVAGGDDFSPRHVVRIEPDRIHIDNSEEHEFRPAVVTDPMIATPHPDRAAFYSLAAGREYYVIVNTRDNTATIKESAVSLKDCRYRRISREEYDKFLVPNDLEKYYEVTYFDGDGVAVAFHQAKDQKAQGKFVFDAVDTIEIAGLMLPLQVVYNTQDGVLVGDQNQSVYVRSIDSQHLRINGQAFAALTKQDDENLDRIVTPKLQSLRQKLGDDKAFLKRMEGGHTPRLLKLLYRGG